jgi:hypothetical protein
LILLKKEVIQDHFFLFIALPVFRRTKFVHSYFHLKVAQLANIILSLSVESNFIKHNLIKTLDFTGHDNGCVNICVPVTCLPKH